MAAQPKPSPKPITKQKLAPVTPKAKPAAKMTVPARKLAAKPTPKPQDSFTSFLGPVAAQPSNPVAGAGLYFDPIQPAPPGPTFPGQVPEDPALAGIGQELDTLGQQSYATAEGRIKQDLASQLAAMRQTGQWNQEDAARRQAEIQRQLPGTLERTKTGFSASGVEFSSAKNRAVDETQRAAETDISDTQRQLERGQAQLDRQMIGAQEQADRELQDIQTKRRADELQNRAQSLKQRQSDDRAEATAWTRARVNQLRTQGLSEQNAQSRAIDEAKSHYGGVDPTFLEGAFTPVKEKMSYAQKAFKRDISYARGERVPPKAREKLRQGAAYAGLKDDLAGYMQTTNEPTAEGFLRYWESLGIAGGRKPSEVKQRAIAWDRILSTLMYDEGLF